MSYQVLALKWRPQVFEDVVGQEPVTRTLANAIQQDRIAHAFLFAGVRGVGKTTTARILAKALNCERGPTVRPCGECVSCREIAEGRSLDVLEIDGASHTKVEEIREVIEATQYAPSRDRFKIYIIDEVHMLSTSSFNALLKTLEEPPPRVKFIFATTEYHKIPETILSRCQQFEFRTVPSALIAERLRRIAEAEGIVIAEAALAQLARAAEGSLRDALSALDQVVAAVGTTIEEKDVTELLGLADTGLLERTAKAIVSRDTAELLRIVARLVEGGRDLRSFARGLVEYFRDVLVVRVAPDDEGLVELGAERDELRALAETLTEEDLLRALDVLTQTESALRWSPEPRFHLEVALLKLSQLARLASFEELLARFESLEGVAPGDGGDGGGGGPGRGKAAAPRGRAAKDEPASRGRRAERPRATAPPSEAAEPVAPTAEEEEEQGSSSTEPSAARAPGAVSLEALLEAARTGKPKLHALLSRAAGARLEGDRFEIRFAPEASVLAAQLEAAAARRWIEARLAELAGRPLRVDVVLGAPEPGPAGAAPPAADEGALRERALADPMVRRFVETFQGEVEEVRRPEPTKEIESR